MRRASLSNAQDGFDIIVIGGGITGAAVARDASLRGLRVIVIEKEDFASGTSSRSSKLIHGGLRYLETFQFGLVAESVRERELALRLAPHLTKVQPFLYLLYEDSPEKRWQLNLGLTFYDIVSGSWRKRRHRMLSARDVMNRQPQFRSKGLKGAALFYDVATDDARLTIDTMKSAAQHGAEVINHCKVVGLIHDDRRCAGVRVLDRCTGTEHVVKGHYVVNCSGPWSEWIQALEGPASLALRLTKGVHIVLRKSDFPLDTAVFMRSPDDGRVVWPIPSIEGDRVYIGTTETAYDGDPNNVHPQQPDVEYLLNVANRLMPDTRLTKDHIVGSWAGLRPLIAPKSDVSNTNTPREHQIVTSASGMFSVIGGKLTSHRIMARHVLDAVVAHDGGGRLPTEMIAYSADKTPLSGASGDHAKAAPRKGYSAARIAGSMMSDGVPANLAWQWARRYGTNASEVASLWLADEDCRRDLAARGLTVAELRYCFFREAAWSIADVMVRRTAAFFWDETGGLDEIHVIADEMQRLTGWSDAEKDRQVEEYRELVNRHRWTSAQASQS